MYYGLTLTLKLILPLLLILWAAGALQISDLLLKWIASNIGCYFPYSLVLDADTRLDLLSCYLQQGGGVKMSITSSWE